MIDHRHLSEEQIFERVSSGEDLPEIAGCASCEAEASSQRAFLAELRRADQASAPATDWDHMVLRGRIREAVAKEAPYRRSIFDRFLVLRPVLASALVASLVLVVWSPWTRVDSGRSTRTAINEMSSAPIPAWNPLPDETDDEGLAVLAEWTPNEDELAIARCRASCLAGLTSHEEESLLNTVSVSASRLPNTEASPL